MLMNIIKEFPILKNQENNQRLVYLDNAATTQKPNVVIDAVMDYYTNSNANPHRGVYELAAKATDIYENGRDKVAKFINSKSPNNIIFTKNTTEALNLLAYSYAGNNIDKGDEILITISEHHANLIPWQMVAKEKGAILKYIYLNDDGIYSQEEIDSKISDRTKIVSVASVSNVLGTRNPVEYLIKKAHEVGAVAIVDAAQSVAHTKTDVQALDADFLVFSGHKMYAPMGVGVLYGKSKLLNSMPPFLTGGDMIIAVHEQESSFAKAPSGFEAGTQDVGGVAGLSAAIDYINSIGLDKIEKHELKLTKYAMEKFKQLDYVKVYGNTSNIELRNGIISFNIGDIHPHDVATIMDLSGVTIRAGHHCAQPLMEFFNIHSCCRASFGVYNNEKDVDALIEAIETVRRTFDFGA